MNIFAKCLANWFSSYTIVSKYKSQTYLRTFILHCEITETIYYKHIMLFAWSGSLNYKTAFGMTIVRCVIQQSKISFTYP